MTSRKKTARLAGLVYLIIVLTGLFSLMYVPVTLIDWNDHATTLNNIRTSQLLYKLGAVAEVICYIAFLVLPLILYKLFKEVHKDYSIIMVIIVIAAVPISYIAIAHKFDVISLFDASNYIGGITNAQLETEMLRSLNSYHNTVLIAQFFWGLWLLPFGYLVYSSGFLPKILGIFLMLGCAGYLVEFLGEVFITNYADTFLSNIAVIPSAIGEIGTCLWLLIAGAKEAGKVNVETN